MTCFVYFEDDDLSGQIMSIMLNYQLGYTDLTVISESSDFANRIKALPTMPDMIFVDIHIRPVNGFDILKGLRADPTFDTAKIVAVTAGVTGAEIDLLQDAGFDGMIGKPIDSRTFPDALLRIFNGERVWHSF